MAKTGKAMGHMAIGMGKLAIKLGQLAVGKNAVAVADGKPIEAEPTEAGQTEPKRNYKSEADWEKSKYKQFSVKIDRELGETFAAQLAKDKISLVDWFRECIGLYMAAHEDSRN